jgi:outer membrane protein TolC
MFVFRAKRSLASLVSCLALGGCVAHQPRPIDPAAMAAALAARTPEDLLDPALGVERPATFDLADGLSLEEGEIVALVFNPELRGARAEAGVAQAAADTAGLWDDPTFGVDLTRILADVDDQWSYTMPITFTIPISGSKDAEREEADAELKAVRAELLDREWATRIEVRTAWVRWSAARQRAATLAALFDRLREVVGIVDRMEAAGEMARIEARLFRIEEAERSAELDERRREEEAAAVELAALLGLPLAATSSCVPIELDAPPVYDDARIAATIAPTVIAARTTTVAAAHARYDASERALATEIRRQYPDLEIGPGIGRDDGENELVLGLSLPIPLWNRNRQGVEVALAERTKAGVALESAIAKAVADAERAKLEWSRSRARRIAIEERIAPLLDEQDRDLRQVAALGEVNSVVLLDSTIRRHDVQLALIDAREREHVAALAFTKAVGPTPVDSPVDSPGDSPVDFPGDSPVAAPVAGTPASNGARP